MINYVSNVFNIVLFIVFIYSSIAYASNISSNVNFEENEKSPVQSFTVRSSNMPEEDFVFFKTYSILDLSSMSFEDFRKVIENEVRKTGAGKALMDQIRNNTQLRLKFKRIVNTMRRPIQNLEIKSFSKKIGQVGEGGDPEGILAKSYFIAFLNKLKRGEMSEELEIQLNTSKTE